MGAEANDDGHSPNSEELGDRSLAPVVVFGVGVGGIRILDDIHQRGARPPARFVALDTEHPDGARPTTRDRIALYRAGRNGFRILRSSEAVSQALREHGRAIEDSIGGSRLAVIIAPLGNLPDGNLSIQVVRMARATGALTIVFAVLPFAFEGDVLSGQAAGDLRALSETANTVIALSSDVLCNWDCRGWSSDIIRHGIGAVAHPFVRSSPNLLQVRPTDLWEVFGRGGVGVIGYARASFAGQLRELLQRVIRSPIGAPGEDLATFARLWVHVVVGSVISRREVFLALPEIWGAAHPEAEVSCSVLPDTAALHRVGVTIMACGGRLPSVKTTAAASDVFRGCTRVISELDQDPEERARKLLEKVLPEQADRYRKEGYILVPSPSREGRVYKVRRPFRPTHILERGRRMARCCLDFVDPELPKTDRVIAEALMIRGDEGFYGDTVHVVRTLRGVLTGWRLKRRTGRAS